MAKVILDAGHGGSDTGDMYEGRREKDDNLRLATRVGKILEDQGIEVAYTRVSDKYISQRERAAIVNQLNGDLLVSIHRLYGESFAPGPSLNFFVTEESGLALEATKNIGNSLSDLNYRNYAVLVRTDIPLLNEVNIPAIMLGIGYIKSPEENQYFDENFEAIAQAIASGIAQTLQTNQEEGELTVTNTNQGNQQCPNCGSLPESNNKYSYRVQVGLFRNYNNALSLQVHLFQMGCPAKIEKQGDLYAVHVGEYDTLDEAAALEHSLRQFGYDTLLVAV